MRAVQVELDIAIEVFEFAVSRYDHDNFRAALTIRSREQLVRAMGNLEVTYFVRLTAEFEGILKDHLRSNHPHIAFPAKPSEWKVDWFLSRVLQRERLKLDPALRENIDSVRTYRNGIAHGNAGATAIRFVDALTWYNTMLAKLPDPLK
jgi:hypothetical protein